MLVSSLVNLSFFLCNGFQNTLMSWITSCIGSFNGGVDNGVTCDIKMRTYDSEFEFEDFPVDGTLSGFQSHFYNSSKKNTVLLALPYLTSIDDNDNQQVIRALCRRCIFNIIVLDNSCSTNTRNVISYPFTMLQIYKDAQRYAEVINRAMRMGLLSAENIYGLGYSLGAQMLGHVCRLLDQPCGYIYAFDPAGPFYIPESFGVSSLLPHMRLVSRGDADVVLFVMCNEGVVGTPFRSGDINLHVNGGTFQPGCPGLSITCNHRFCLKIMVNSILTSGSCQGRLCGSKTLFDKGICNYNSIITLSLPPDNRLTYKFQEQIDFYMDTLQTDSCQGFYGSKHNQR